MRLHPAATILMLALALPRLAWASVRADQMDRNTPEPTLDNQSHQGSRIAQACENDCPLIVGFPAPQRPYQPAPEVRRRLEKPEAEPAPPSRSSESKYRPRIKDRPKPHPYSSGHEQAPPIYRHYGRTRQVTVTIITPEQASKPCPPVKARSSGARAPTTIVLRPVPVKRAATAKPSQRKPAPKPVYTRVRRPTIKPAATRIRRPSSSVSANRQLAQIERSKLEALRQIADRQAIAEASLRRIQDQTAESLAKARAAAEVANRAAAEAAARTAPVEPPIEPPVKPGRDYKRYLGIGALVLLALLLVAIAATLAKAFLGRRP